MRQKKSVLFGAWLQGWKEDSALDKAVFLFLLLLYTGIMLYLFAMQCYEVPDFQSDMPDYVNTVRGIAGNYQFPYPLFFTAAKIFSPFVGAPMAVALVTALLNSLGLWIAKGYMNLGARCLLAEKEDGTGVGNGSGKRSRAGLDLAVTFLAFALFLLGNLYSPKNTAFFGFDYAYRCMGIYTPNPIWNATYMATRGFAVICFFEGCRVLGLVDRLWKDGAAGAPEGASISGRRRDFCRACVPFAVSLFLTTITKPSFTMVMVPAMGIVLLVQLLVSRGRSFRCAFLLCVCMLPTGMDLLYQFFGVFTGTNVMGEETGIGFAFAKVWNIYSKNIPLSVLMGMALPIGVLMLNGRELLKTAYYRFAWMLYLMGTFLFLCLYEKGFRMPHANFSWGYMHGMFFVYMLTLLLVLKNTIQWRKSYKVVFVLAEWAVFFYHLTCGVNFLVYALRGQNLAGF